MAGNMDFGSCCDLVVDNFPANRNTLLSPDFKLVYENDWILHYWLKNNCHLKVYRKKDGDIFLPNLRRNDGHRRGTQIHFDIRGAISEGALRQVVSFLQLYTNHQGCAASIETQTDQKAVDKLEYTVRKELVRHLCSGKSYECVDDLLDGLYAFLCGSTKEVMEYISGRSSENQLDVISQQSRLWLQFRQNYWRTVYPEDQTEREKAE